MFSSRLEHPCLELRHARAGLCVSVVKRVLRWQGTAADAQCLTAVRQICDEFADAGWPRARQLFFGIEQTFR